MGDLNGDGIGDLAVGAYSPGITYIKRGAVWILFLDPYAIDTDYDGMPNKWEIDNGLDPLLNDADLDADKDGFSNLLEYLRGTDPQNPEDHPTRGMPWLPLLLGDD